MRTAKQLKDLVDNALTVCGGTMPLVLVCEDKEEMDAIGALLKGRRGGKSITTRLCKSPKEFTPIMDLVYARSGVVWDDAPVNPPERPPVIAPSKAKPKPEPAPAVADDLDYDGY